MSSHPPVLVSVDGLRKAYRAGVLGCRASVQVLHGVTLRVRAGECVAVEAPRAAGKTTLLFCVAGMLRPDAGAVRWSALPARVGRPPSGIAYVSDRPPPYAFLSAREALVYAASVHELHQPGAARHADALLALCALHDVADIRIGLLAPAERARLAVATGLVTSPRLLLVDAVNGGPELRGRRAFAAMLTRLAGEGIGLLWASRDTAVAPEAAFTWRLERGRLRRTAGGGAPPRERSSLELELSAAAATDGVLRSFPAVRAGDRTVRVPLGDASPEEVLAWCRDRSVTVLRSAVVREPAPERSSAPD